MLRGATTVAALIAVVPLTVAVAAPAWGDAPADSKPPKSPKLGIDVGLQLGYGRPFGNVGAGPEMAVDDIVASVVPVGLDLSYRIDELIAVGLLLQYGIVQFQDTEQACPTGGRCSGFLASVAAQVTVRAPVPWAVVPWLRLGGGYEWLRLHLTGTAGFEQADLAVTWRGVMFGVAQVGADYQLMHALAIGPVVGLSVGRYDFSSVSGTFGGTPQPDQPMAVPDKALHEWFMVGVRGVFHF
jgi:hypothetical protein